MSSHGGGLPQPVFRPVGDCALLVEFGDRIDDQIHDAVLNLDASVQLANIDGVIENVPAYASLLIDYDPLLTDYFTLCKQVEKCLATGGNINRASVEWSIPVCYSTEFGVDLPAVASLLKISVEEIIQEHTRATFKVYMYGFAAGYAYLGGTPESIQLPRKQAPVNNVPAGSVIIAGPQALITTITMPSGWWIIGRTHETPLQKNDDQPFLFNVGDSVRFTSISEEEYSAGLTQEGVA